MASGQFTTCKHIIGLWQAWPVHEQKLGYLRRCSVPADDMCTN